jgi:hypothetical protein
MYKIKKRAITLLVLATLLLSFIPIMSASAITIDALSAATGDEGDTIEVTGLAGDVPAGYTVELYWDDVTIDWNGVKGKLNSTTADSDGSWEVWFDVPEAEAGEHYVWVKDPDGTDSIAFTVVPKVKVSPSSGLEGERTFADFYGFDGGRDLAILFVEDEDPALWSITAVVAEALGTGDGAEEDFDGTLLNDPVALMSMDVDIGGVLAFSDTAGDGKLVAQGNFTGSGKVNYVTGEWELNDVQDGGVAIGAVAITADYDYYDDVGDQEVLATGATNSLGSLTSKRLTIPDPTPDDKYYIAGVDEKGNVGTDDYTVGSVIEISDDEVETGDLITVKGRGFTPLGTIVSVALWKDDVYETMFTIVDDEDDIDDDGEFNIEVVLPEGSKKDDDFVLNITDSGDRIATADLEIVGLSKIEVDPEYGPGGSTIGYSGSNFPKMKGEEVTLELWLGGIYQRDLATDIETNSDGTISGTFKVPPVDQDTYDIIAQCEDHDIAPDTEFRVGRIIVILYEEDEGPAGMEVELTGSGFTENGEWNATFGDIELFSGEVAGATGLIAGYFFHVPQVDPGTYEITTWDVDSEITVVVEFTVTATTEASITPAEAPRKYNMTIEGMYWPDDDRDIEFTLWNDTDDWDITGDVGTGAGNADVTSSNAEAVTGDGDDGQWIGWWKIDDTTELDEGVYHINVTDADEDFYIELMFTVGPIHKHISPRKSTFRIGDTVTFNIEHSYGNVGGEGINGGMINVYDPDGNLYWVGDPLVTWTDVDLWWVVPVSDQTANGNPMILLDDAPLGEWSFEWLDVDDEELDTGTFTVQASEADVLSGQIEDLAGELSDLSDDVAGVSDEIAGVQDDIADAIAAANAATQAANAATDAVNSIAKTADAAVDAANAAADAAEDAKAASSGLTTLVYGAIGASLVAALAAIVSLMQISRRIAG